MSAIDFSNYRRDDKLNYLWRSNGLSSADIKNLPIGSIFFVLVAPRFQAQWHLAMLRVDMHSDPVSKKRYRAVMNYKSVNLDYSPFEWAYEELYSKEELASMGKTETIAETKGAQS